ncbi:MAG: sensor histidine kinase [Bacteroidota bacterium]|nr:sensor histidine kinase [Bacteroidota bacterium]
MYSEEKIIKKENRRDSWLWAQTLFWLIIASFFYYISPPTWGWAPALLWSISETLFFAILVNINTKLLIPRFMLNQSFFLYIVVLIGLVLLSTPIKILSNTTLLQFFSLRTYAWVTDPGFNFISLLIVTALSSLVRIPLDWLSIQKEKKELITKNIQTELQFLKNQINPHFLFNTLNNLYALTLKKSDLAPDVVLKLSDMMRYMLYECNEKEVPLEKELRYIHNYIELEKLRLSKPADIRVQITGDISHSSVAPLLLIPFIENSFKHGLKLSIDDSFIHVNLNQTEDAIQFQIINSKPPKIAAIFNGSKVGGIGLVNVKKRLEIIYPNRHKLEILDRPDSFEIKLNLQTTNFNKNDTYPDRG